MSNDLDRLRLENLHLRCVLLEASKELSSFWEAHTAEGGLGPTRLQSYLTLEKEISSAENPYPKNEFEVKGKSENA